MPLAIKEMEGVRNYIVIAEAHVSLNVNWWNVSIWHTLHFLFLSYGLWFHISHSRLLRNTNEILHRIDQLTSGFYTIQIYTLRLNMCINFLRPPPILICSVYSSAVLWKVIVNCSNINNEWECLQNQKL